MPTTTQTPVTQPVEIVAGVGQPKPPEWQMRTFASMTAAQELLDSLEAQGFAEREFVVLGKASFAVKWC
jgi:hypothetical protein